jgi:hypothetical protein
MKPDKQLWRIEYGEIVDADGAYIARAYEENLEYILHACNAYPRLVEAVRDADGHIGYPWKGSDLLEELGEN